MSHLRLLSSCLCPSHSPDSPSENNVLGRCDCPNSALPCPLGSLLQQCWGLSGHCITLVQLLSAPRASLSTFFPMEELMLAGVMFPSPCPPWVSLYPPGCPCSGPARPTSGQDQAGAAQPVLGAVILQPRAGSLCRLWGQVPLQLLVGSTGTRLPTEPSGALHHAVLSQSVSPSAPLPPLPRQCLRQETPRRVQAINAARHAGVPCTPRGGPAPAGPGRASRGCPRSCPRGGPGPARPAGAAAAAAAAALRRAAPAHAHAKDDV